MLQRAKTYLSKVPKWRLWLCLALFVSVCAYGAYLKWGNKAPAPGTVIISTSIAPVIAEMETTVTGPVKLTVIKDKAKAVKKLGLPASEAANPKEEVLTATVAPKSKHGTTVTTFVNMSTGKPRTDIVVNKAPWFSFERGNTIGLEAGYGMKGKYAQVDWDHEFAQVKGIYVAGKASGTFYDTTSGDNASDLRIGVRLQKHFDWP